MRPELVIEHLVECPGTSRRKGLMLIAVVTEFAVGILGGVGVGLFR